MPRVSVHSWAQEDLVSALRRIELGELSIRKAAIEYDIPYTTLRDKFSGKSPVFARHGPNPFLTEEEEESIVDWAIKMSRKGFGQNKEDIQNVVKKMLEKDERPNPFVNNKPGQRWWRSFRDRHPQLVFRKPQAIGKERTVVTTERVDRWFKEFEEYLESENALSILQEPRRFFNADESGFALGGRVGDRVLAEKGEKCVQQFKNSNKGQVTVMVTCCAAGGYLPPLIILPGRHSQKGEEYEGGPKNAYFSRTKNGWMDSDTFFSYLANLFHPFLVQMRVPLPALLLVDGLSAHKTPRVAKFCQANQIILYRLPPHSTHLLQPCDVSVFRSLKTSWYRAEKDYRFLNPGDYVTPRTFPKVFKQAWDELFKKPEIASSGFRRAGLYPFTKEYNSTLLRPATIYKFTRPTTIDEDTAPATTPPDASDDTTDMTEEEQLPIIPISASSEMDTTEIAPAPSASITHTDSAIIYPQEFVCQALRECLVLPEVEVSHERKRKRELPSAISGTEYVKYADARRKLELEEAERKKRRAEERKMKKVERERSKQKAMEERRIRKEEAAAARIERTKRQQEKRERRREERKRLDEEKEKKKMEKKENHKEKSGKCKQKSIVIEEEVIIYVCPECGLVGEEGDPWVPCDECNNWVHTYCTGFSSIDEEEWHKYNFKCRFC